MKSISVISAIFIILFLAGLRIGSFDTSWDTLANAILHYNPDDATHYAIMNLRMPRLILAFLVGGALAISGYLMQAMVSNPLADPYLLGTSSGASLGASFALSGILPVAFLGIFSSSVFAFIGALAVTLIAILVSYEKGQIIPTRLLLGGVALSSLMVALMTLLTYISDDEGKLKSIIYWSLGSFDLARWEYIPLLSVVLIIFTILFMFYTKQLNILLLGDSRAKNLGVDIRRMRWFVLTGCSVLTGFAVATSGPIGFVGLIVPHFVRALYGVNGKYNILFAVFTGGVFMLACDILSRIIIPGISLPIGIITSFLGIPFFVYLLLKNNYRF